MNIRLLFVLSWLVTIPSVLTAQDSYQLGALPSINLNKKWDSGWRWNAKVESRQLFKEGDFKTTVPFDYIYELTDFSNIFSKQLGAQQSIAGGYLIRFRNQEWFHRSIQQFVITKRYQGLRLAHRFSADQTFSQINAPEFRFRYRISIEKSLSGTSVDPKEFYLKLNHEYLLGYQSIDTDLELRLVPLLGYELNDFNKIEAGLDYRVSSLLNNVDSHRFFITINWFITLL